MDVSDAAVAGFAVGLLTGCAFTLLWLFAAGVL